MKKLIVFCTVAVLLLTLVFAVGAEKYQKEVKLNPDNKVAVVRGSDKIADLFDGNKVWEAQNVFNFDTDGIVLIQNTDCMSDGVYNTCDLIIDLGGEKKIDTINVTFFHYLNAMIGMPMNNEAIVSVSYDEGKSFAEIGKYPLKGEADIALAGIYDEYIHLEKTYKCHAVMVSFVYGDTLDAWSKPMLEWFGFTELSAGLKADYADEEAALEASAAAENTSSEEESAAGSEAESGTESGDETSADTSSAASAESSKAESSKAESSKAESAEESTVVSESSENTEEPAPSNSWIIWVIVCGLVIAGATVAIIFAVKKR